MNPKRYVPTSLRRDGYQKRELAFGIGTEVAPFHHEMYYGPVPTLEECLEFVPSKEKSRIFQFNEDGTEEIIYNWQNGGWDSVR